MSKHQTKRFLTYATILALCLGLATGWAGRGLLQRSGSNKAEQLDTTGLVAAGELKFHESVSIAPDSGTVTIEHRSGSVYRLPDSRVKRLEFLYQFANSNDHRLADVVCDVFAKASYGDLKEASRAFRRNDLLQWIEDKSVPDNRKNVYYTLLGIVGIPEDAEVLAEMLHGSADNPSLYSLIRSYLMLKKEDGLPLINKLFIENAKSPYNDTYAAVQALRFLAEDGRFIDRLGLVSSFQLLLKRPEFADIVLPDLVRNEDWTQVERVAAFLETQNEENTFVRVPAINYLRACPLRAAKEKLAALER